MSVSHFFKHLSYTFRFPFPIHSRRLIHQLSSSPSPPTRSSLFSSSTHQSTLNSIISYFSTSSSSEALTIHSSASPYLSVRIQCPKDVADMLSEALLCFGASSTSVDERDSNESTDEICISSIFAECQDVDVCISHAADSIGLKEIPSYEVRIGEQYDWIKKTQLWKARNTKVLEGKFTHPLAILEAATKLHMKYMNPQGEERIRSYDKPRRQDHKRTFIKWNHFIQWKLPRDFGLFLSGKLPQYDYLKLSSLKDVLSTNIIINPGLAFGTGEHPTTKLCLLLLHGLIKGKEHFLDYGTGSGILAIAALKFGAALSVGVDIDPQAMTSARQNAALNNIEPEKMQLHLVPSKMGPPSIDEGPCGVVEGQGSYGKGIISETESYDVVIANILLNPLLDLADHIVSYAKPGAVIGVSGILSEQLPYIIERYSQLLEGISVSEMDDWACVRGTKKRNVTGS